MNQGEFILMGLGVVILLGNAVTAWAVITGKAGKREIQQPLRVQHEKEVITKAEHVEHCAFMERRVFALEARTDRIERKMETDKTEIIAAGQERLDELKAEIREVRNDLHAQPAQIVALFKNMKGLID
jgi:chromosome segregation ATPase